MSQNDQILAWLKRGLVITPLEGLTRFGSFRLAARIYDLRRRGYRIDRRLVSGGERTRYAEYRLVAAARGK